MNAGCGGKDEPDQCSALVGDGLSSGRHAGLHVLSAFIARSGIMMVCFDTFERIEDLRVAKGLLNDMAKRLGDSPRLLHSFRDV